MTAEFSYFLILSFTVLMEEIQYLISNPILPINFLFFLFLFSMIIFQHFIKSSLIMFNLFSLLFKSLLILSI